MIDFDDGTDALLIVGGPIGLVLAIVLWVLAAQNSKECSEMQCPHGGNAVLMDHDCRCVEAPLPRGSR